MAPRKTRRAISATTSLGRGPTRATPVSRRRYQFWSQSDAGPVTWNGSPGPHDGQRRPARRRRTKHRAIDVDDLEAVRPRWMLTDDLSVDSFQSNEVERVDAASRDGDEVAVAHAGVEPTGNDRTVEIEPDQVPGKDTTEVGDERVDHGPDRGLGGEPHDERRLAAAEWRVNRALAEPPGPPHLVARVPVVVAANAATSGTLRVRFRAARTPEPSTLDLRRLGPDNFPAAVPAFAEVRVPVAAAGRACAGDGEGDLGGIADDGHVPVGANDDVARLPEIGDVAVRTASRYSSFVSTRPAGVMNWKSAAWNGAASRMSASTSAFNRARSSRCEVVHSAASVLLGAASPVPGFPGQSTPAHGS